MAEQKVSLEEVIEIFNQEINRLKQRQQATELYMRIIIARLEQEGSLGAATGSDLAHALANRVETIKSDGVADLAAVIRDVWTDDLPDAEIIDFNPSSS